MKITSACILASGRNGRGGIALRSRIVKVATARSIGLPSAGDVG